MNDTTRNAATTDPRSEDRIREDIERDRTEGTVPYPGPAAAPLGTRREADAIEDDVAAQSAGLDDPARPSIAQIRRTRPRSVLIYGIGMVGIVIVILVVASLF